MADLSRFRSPYSSFAGLSSTYNSLLQNGCYSSAASGYAASYSQGLLCAFHLMTAICPLLGSFGNLGRQGSWNIGIGHQAYQWGP